MAREGDAMTLGHLFETWSKGNNGDIKLRKKIDFLDDNKTSPLHYAARYLIKIRYLRLAEVL